MFVERSIKCKQRITTRGVYKSSRQQDSRRVCTSEVAGLEPFKCRTIIPQSVSKPFLK